MVNDLHGSVSDLVGREEFMKLGKVWVGLENVEQVERQVDRLLVVIAKSARHCAEESLMLEHEFHILVREAQVE